MTLRKKAQPKRNPCNRRPNRGDSFFSFIKKLNPKIKKLFHSPLPRPWNKESKQPEQK